MAQSSLSRYLCEAFFDLFSRSKRAEILKYVIITDKTFIKLNIALTSFHRHFRTLIEINKFNKWCAVRFQ